MTKFNFNELNKNLYNATVELENVLTDAVNALNEAEDYAMELFHSVTEKEANDTIIEADYTAMEKANEAERKARDYAETVEHLSLILKKACEVMEFGELIQ